MTDPDDDHRSLSERSETQRPVAEIPEVFPPTLREVMLRGRWLAMLALCLVVAGVFAWLGQWQLGRAVQTDPTPPGATEEIRLIDDVVAPGDYLPEPLVGQRASVSGWWIADDFIVVSSRYNDGVEGYWVTGQFRRWDGNEGFDQAEQPVSLAVAVGWTAVRADADAAAAELSAMPHVVDLGGPATLTGRLISDEGPALPPSDADPFELTRMSPPALLSRWHDIDGLDVYRPYLVADDLAGLESLAPEGLVEITSTAPAEASGINWLNAFYALEWAVFAGFAFYLWYRLARDAWEKEVEDFEDAAAP